MCAYTAVEPGFLHAFNTVHLFDDIMNSRNGGIRVVECLCMKIIGCFLNQFRRNINNKMYTKVFSILNGKKIFIYI